MAQRMSVGTGTLVAFLVASAAAACLLVGRGVPIDDDPKTAGLGIESVGISGETDSEGFPRPARRAATTADPAPVFVSSSEGDRADRVETLAVQGSPGEPATPIAVATSQAARERLVEALSLRPIDWGDVQALLSAYAGPLPEAIRELLYAEIVGRECEATAQAVAAARDPTLAGDLVALLDRTRGNRRARALIANVLAVLPADDNARIVSEIALRLTGEVEDDLFLLRALGRRGGPEAADALTEYLLGRDPTFRLPPNAHVDLEVAGDPKTVAVLVDAMDRASNPAQLVALIRLSSDPEAAETVPTLIRYTEAGQPEEVQAEALEALGVVGTGPAVAHILEVSAQDGPGAELARASLARLQQVTPQARAELLAALAGTTRPPSPPQRLALLYALSCVGGAEAVEPMAKALADPDPEVQAVAVRGLGQLGEVARPRVGTLLESYREGGDALRSDVVAALGGIGGTEARAALDAVLRDETLSPGLRQDARRALKRTLHR